MPKGVNRRWGSVVGATECFAHRLHQREDFLVADSIEDLIGILSRTEDPFIAQDRQMLGDVALGGPHQIHQVLNADLVTSRKNAEDLESQRVTHRFERARGDVQVRLAGKKHLLSTDDIFSRVGELFLLKCH